MSRYLQRAVTWRESSDPEVPLVADVGGERWCLRLGDFPAEPLFTLEINGRVIGSVDNWPAAWQRPSS